MEIQEVEVFIKPDGEVSYEVKGVKGRKCVFEDLESDLGNEIISREETSEMYEQEISEEIDQRISCS